MSKTTGNSNQVISLPKSGGTLHAFEEKFSADLHTGTGNFAIPIVPPPGHYGFHPQLTLVYRTGNGDGPLGLGWSLIILGVNRKTSKAVPLFVITYSAAYRDGSASRKIFCLWQ